MHIITYMFIYSHIYACHLYIYIFLFASSKLSAQSGRKICLLLYSFKNKSYLPVSALIHAIMMLLVHLTPFFLEAVSRGTSI